ALLLPYTTLFRSVLGALTAARRAVAAGEAGGDGGGVRLRETRPRHPERPQHRLLQVVRERGARHRLDQVTGQRHTVVVVAGDLTRRAHPARLVRGEALAERAHVLGPGGGPPDDGVVEARRVREQIAYRHGVSRIRVLHLEGPEVAVDVGRQVETAALHLLQDRDRREQLGVGGEEGPGAPRVDRGPRVGVGAAVAAGEDRPAALDDHHRRAGDPVVGELPAHERVDGARQTGRPVGRGESGGGAGLRVHRGSRGGGAGAPRQEQRDAQREEQVPQSL